MNITILGPMPDRQIGEYHVHATDCPERPRGRSYVYDTADVPDKRTVIERLYGPLPEEGRARRTRYLFNTRFFDCCYDLPFEGAADAVG